MSIIFLFGLLVIAGWVLGIVGFFRAQAAHAELRALRRALAQAAPRQAPPAETAPVDAPFTATAPRPSAAPPDSTAPEA